MFFLIILIIITTIKIIIVILIRVIIIIIVIIIVVVWYAMSVHTLKPKTFLFNAKFHIPKPKTHPKPSPLFLMVSSKA